MEDKDYNLIEDYFNGGLDDASGTRKAQSYSRRKHAVEMPGNTPDQVDSPLNKIPDMEELARWAKGDVP